MFNDDIVKWFIVGNPDDMDVARAFYEFDINQAACPADVIYVGHSAWGTESFLSAWLKSRRLKAEIKIVPSGKSVFFRDCHILREFRPTHLLVFDPLHNPRAQFAKKVASLLFIPCDTVND